MPEKIIASTQDHLDIEDIRDDMVILKTGNAVLVLQTNAVNFDLLSEKEQDAMIFAYAGLLNSLSFPIQVMVISRLTDISSYQQKLEDAKKATPNTKIVSQIQKYQEFIAGLVSKNQVLDKRFYVIIPYMQLSLSQLSPLPFVSKKGGRVNFDKYALIQKARLSLEPKREHLLKQLARIGVKARQLTTQELVELFYDTYNQSTAREQKVALAHSSYTTPIIEPAIESEVVEKGRGQ